MRDTQSGASCLSPGAGPHTHRVLTMSTGMEAAVVTKPLIMLAQKWQRMLSEK